MSDAISSFVGLSLPVLAQLAAPDQDSAAIWWLVGLAAVAVAFNQIASAWSRITGRFENKPSGAHYQTEESCRSLHKDLDHTLQTMNREHSERTEKLREQILLDLAAVYQRIEDKTDGMNVRLTTIAQAIGDLGGQVKRIANGGTHAS